MKNIIRKSKKGFSFVLAWIMVLSTVLSMKTTALADKIEDRLAIGDTLRAYGTSNYLDGFYYGRSYELNVNEMGK